MKFTQGAILGDLSGKLGSCVASRNRYGGYLRSRVIPVNPQSTRQELIRNRFADLTNWWNEQLTAAQRSGWDTYALNVPIQGKNGSTNYITGFNHFIRTNTEVLEAGDSVIEDAPALFSLPETDPTLAFTASEASQNMSVTFDNAKPWANEVGGHMLIFMGRPQLNNRNYFGGPWGFADAINGAATPPTSPATVAAPFAITQGQRLWTYARVLRADGRLSEPFRAGPVVVGA